MDTIIIAVSSITVIGAVCAALLSIASKFMHVAVDGRVSQIQDSLPGTNCGACGFPGCSGFAAALVSDPSVKPNRCTPGGAETVAKISAILGVESEAAVKKMAVVRCGGDASSRTQKMEYAGISTCYAAANFTYTGNAACSYGCFGFGDCKTVCPVDAVCVENGLARVSPLLCNGCGLCAKICPNNIIAIEESTIKAVVVCSNIEKAAVVRKKCARACLGCGLCARKCTVEAIKIDNNLAHINYGVCTDCGACVASCPTKCVKAY
jgi:RnfABCDGE-type electron transport complex B subunit